MTRKLFGGGQKISAVFEDFLHIYYKNGVILLQLFRIIERKKAVRGKEKRFLIPADGGPTCGGEENSAQGYEYTGRARARLFLSGKEIFCRIEGGGAQKRPAA